MGDGASEMAKKWLEGVIDGRVCQAIETIALQGLQIVRAESGLIQCGFVVPKPLAGKDGNWVAGAIATMIDNIGAVAVVSSVGYFKASVNFDISYFSTAKIGEEVEIEGKVLVHKGKLSAIVVEIRKKKNGEMVAIGKQWTSSVNAADKEGNWHMGAIATMIDNVGAVAVGSSEGEVKASACFDITYFSVAKIREEVEIEAKVLENRDRLSAVTVEVRRKENGKLIALGNQWMITVTRNKSRPSKL